MLVESKKFSFDEWSRLRTAEEIFEVVRNFGLEEFYRSFKLVRPEEFAESVQDDLMMIPEYAREMSFLSFQFGSMYGYDGLLVRTGCLKYEHVDISDTFQMKALLKKLLLKNNLYDIESDEENLKEMKKWEDEFKKIL